MNLYTICKIDSNFKLFYNFKTLCFDNRENNLTSENFITSNVFCAKICENINNKETLKEYGAQNYSFVKQVVLTKTK